jgi:hypothetical protein
MYRIFMYMKVILTIAPLLLSGCAGYFAPTLVEHRQPIQDPAQCSRYYGSPTAPSWFNALVFPGASGIQTNNAFDTLLLAANGGSTGSFDQAVYDRCSKKARENVYQGN